MPSTPSVSASAFRESLAQWASGVAVVAARGASRLVGVTATAFTSVSLSPPLVLVSISRDASVHETLAQSLVFGISILEEDQGWLAAQFAAREADRFAGVALEPSSEIPLIRDAIARIECRRYEVHVAGDHSLLLGEVVGAAVSPGRPLVHFARRFTSLGSHLAASSTGGSSPERARA